MAIRRIIIDVHEVDHGDFCFTPLEVDIMTDRCIEALQGAGYIIADTRTEKLEDYNEPP